MSIFLNCDKCKKTSKAWTIICPFCLQSKIIDIDQELKKNKQKLTIDINCKN